MKKTNKGFTLAEMLIVVAIIGVLIAIIVPAFSTQLEKARETTDAANIRSKVAELTSKVLTDQVGYQATVDVTQKTEGWDSKVSIGGVSMSGVQGNNKYYLVVVDASGVASVSDSAKQIADATPIK